MTNSNFEYKETGSEEREEDTLETQLQRSIDTLSMYHLSSEREVLQPQSPKTVGYGERKQHLDMVGSVIRAKYKLVELIARGGAANVFKCERLLVGDKVALKMLFPEFAADPAKSKRFHLEASTTASIKHPSVLTIYDFDFSEEGVPFIVTELLKGVTLFEELQRVGRLTLQRAVRIIGPVCSALSVAHASGIIHRDLKPANIILHTMEDGSEAVKLIDFGIAKNKEERKGFIQTEPGMVFGTPAYMAPEHCLGEHLDNRADIYSLGVLLFEMITGQLPFEADTPSKMMLKQIKETPPSLKEFCPNLPAGVEALIMCALSKRPEQRFTSAIELVDQLREAIK
ncbi:MAG: serine/threonine protein kinase [Blastocatellia bacterium]|nr:serine/threonine protein kinase [Blastocatellia bacterium]